MRAAYPTTCLLGTAVLAAVGCCGVDMPLAHPEALLDGYAGLKCIAWDGDNTTLDFAYQLPDTLSVDAAFETLQARIERSGMEKGGSPARTCFRVVYRRPKQLLLVCDKPLDEIPYAWFFQLEGRTLRATTGPPAVILDFAR